MEITSHRCLQQPPSRRSTLAWLSLPVVILLLGCQETPSPSDAPAKRGEPPTSSVVPPRASSSIAGSFQSTVPTKLEKSTATNVRFVDRASELGVEHSYQNGAAGNRLMVEATGASCGWVDFDRDGWSDLYLPQGGNPSERAGPTQPTDRLYHNIGGTSFVDITSLSGIDERGYSQGVAVGDFDDDGFDDIYVTNVGPNSFFRNQGDGTFEETAQQLSIAGNLWSSSAAWADIDRDGDLDLYVCNYVNFDPLNPRICHNAKGIPAMCHPKLMEAVPDECYLNLGDGTFRPAAKELGLFGPDNKALGVAIADFTGDGWPDIFVANDTTPNFLFVSQEGRKFEESASLLGCAVSSQGLPQANMGVAVGDYDSNGFLDLCITHFSGEWATLYENLGSQGFHDVSARVGLVGPTSRRLGFGTVMADFDQDGRQELFFANGHIDDLRFQGDEFEMEPQLFSFDGRRWFECGQQAGDYFTRRLIGRGVAMADFDNDGDLDLAVGHQNTPVAILQNESVRGGWLQLDLVGRVSNRRGVGARVVVHLPSGDLVQEVMGGTSFCAAHQLKLCFGFGDITESVSLDILWPSGIRQRLTDVNPKQSLVIVESVTTSTDSGTTR